MHKQFDAQVMEYLGDENSLLTKEAFRELKLVFYFSKHSWVTSK